MSKRAEAAALKAYPNVEQPVWDKSYPKTLFVRHTERNAFIKGYEQAEKDLALTAEDVLLLMYIWTELPDFQFKTLEAIAEETLKRFNEQRKKTRYYVRCDECGKTIETNAANEKNSL